MNYNEIKKNLEEIAGIEKLIKSSNDELEIFKSRTLRIAKYEEKSSKCGCIGTMEILYEKIADKEERIRDLFFLKENALELFWTLLKNLSCEEQSILIDRYVNCYTLRIMYEKHYFASEQSICNKIENIIKYCANKVD